MTTFRGLIGIEQCHTGSASTVCEKYCGTGCASSNWWVSYANAYLCAGHSCDFRGACAGGGCGHASVNVETCSGAATYYGAILKECGPSASKASGFTCKLGGKYNSNIYASAPVDFFRSACGCSPYEYGFWKTGFSVV